MDPLSALGIAAAIAQFIDLGYKVVKRLSEYGEISNKEVPRSLQSINTRLPLLLISLSRIQSNAEIDKLDTDSKCILRGVVSGCSNLTVQINDILNRISKQPGQSFTIKLKKAFASFKADDLIASLDQDLQMYIHLLVLHHVVEQSDWSRARFDAGSRHFVVKAVLTDETRIRREKLLGQLYSATSEVSLIDKPLYVELYGVEAAGKTQLALQYAHDAYKAEHYSHVFWLDARSHSILALGLQHIAEIVYNTKLSDEVEKLRLTKDFLEGSVRPWLLVLDNCQKASLQGDLFPTRGYGTVLLTTRQPIRLDVQAIRVPKFLTPDQHKEMRKKLQSAIWNKNLNVVKETLSTDFDVNTETEGQDPRKFVNYAVSRGFTEGMLELLDHGADAANLIYEVVYADSISLLSNYLDWEDRTHYRDSTVNYALAARRVLGLGSLEKVALLLERRAFMFDEAVSHDGFCKAAEGGHLDVLKLLKSSDKLPKGRQLDRALCEAIENGNLEVAEFLIDSGASLSSDAGDNMYTPLMCAVSRVFKGSLKSRSHILVSLLEKGSGTVLNLRNAWEGTTPLYKAIQTDEISIVKILLAHGADPTMTNKSGDNALGAAASRHCIEMYDLLTTLDSHKYQDYYVRGLFSAIRQGDRDLLLRVWDKVEDKNTLNEDGYTPLSAAIMRDQAPMALLMLRKGADITARDRDQMTPWLLAAQRGMHQLIEWMANKYPSTLEERTHYGNTALMLATKANKRKSHDKTIEALIKAGADEQAINDYGETAKEIAEAKTNENYF